MFGCRNAAEHSHSLGPGTYVTLCDKHYQKILEEVSDESSKPNETK